MERRYTAFSRLRFQGVARRAATAQARPRPADCAGVRERILAVEDDPAIQRILERVLTHRGSEVVVAATGEDALRAIDADLFDLALVDYGIPAPNGLEVLQYLSTVQPECVRVLMSGQLDLPVTMAAVNRGDVSRVLQKPFRMAELSALVDSAIASRERAARRIGARRDRNDRRRYEALVDCLRGDYLSLAVQPICTATSDRRIVAFEALLRSRHEELDNPGALLSAAEQFDRIEDLGAIVARLAAEWVCRFPLDVRLFMNLHPAELGNPDAMVRRLQPLVPYAPRVVLEITERSSIAGVSSLPDAIARLSELGFAIAVDDLGAGYSSLSVLADLDPQFIKVDMSIVRHIDRDPRKRRLMELLCRFADATESLVIAEGVETEAEAATAIDCGVHLLQGYLLGRPGFELPERAAVAEAVA
ncbi:MAG: EAL domain-containing protein [Deltaproteobacteria bacterium]|nr:MAG: EAL domain-containing protein [Deltaproteobacteria bacterium]